MSSETIGTSLAEVQELVREWGAREAIHAQDERFYQAASVLRCRNELRAVADRLEAAMKTAPERINLGFEEDEEALRAELGLDDEVHFVERIPDEGDEG